MRSASATTARRRMFAGSRRSRTARAPSASDPGVVVELLRRRGHDRARSRCRSSPSGRAARCRPRPGTSPSAAPSTSFQLVDVAHDDRAADPERAAVDGAAVALADLAPGPPTGPRGSPGRRSPRSRGGPTRFAPVTQFAPPRTEGRRTPSRRRGTPGAPRSPSRSRARRSPRRRTARTSAGKNRRASFFSFTSRSPGHEHGDRPAAGVEQHALQHRRGRQPSCSATASIVAAPGVSTSVHGLRARSAAGSAGAAAWPPRCRRRSRRSRTRRTGPRPPRPPP